MKITLVQLRTFVAVSRERSFTRAAKVLASSQPTVSAAIQQLEAALNLTLFDRTTKELHLTKESKAFLPVIKRLLDDLDSAIGDLHAAAEGSTGSVAVAVLPSIADNILPATISRFSETFPKIRISLRDDNNTGVLERVRSGEVDLGIAGHIQHSEGLSFMTLIRDPFGAVMHSSHPLAEEQGPLGWQEFSKYRVIALAADTGIRQILDTLQMVPENFASPWIEVSNIATVLALLKANLGIAALPEMTMRSGCDDLVFRTLLDPHLYRELALVTREGRSLSPAASSFVEHVRQVLKPQWLR